MLAKRFLMILQITTRIPDCTHCSVAGFPCAGSCILMRSTLAQRLWWRLCIRLRSMPSPRWRVTVWSSSPSTSEPTTHSCSSLRLLCTDFQLQLSDIKPLYRNSSPKNSAIIYSPLGWRRVRRSFLVHKTIVEHHSKTALQNSEEAPFGLPS